MGERQITGRHVLFGFMAAFGVIIAVNLWLAISAVRTFPGLEEKNAYVASQTFDARRAAQESLGWTARAVLTGDGLRLSLRNTQGQPVQPVTLTAVLARPTIANQDHEPALVFDGRDYVSEAVPAAGEWTLRLRATADDGTEFRQRLDVIRE